MTTRAELNQALDRYRTARTEHVVEQLDTAAAFGDEETATDAREILAMIERVNRARNTEPHYFAARLHDTSDRLEAFANRNTTRNPA